VLARESHYGRSCEDIVEEVNNNDQTRIDQEVQNVKDLIEEEAAKPPERWWENYADKYEDDEGEDEESNDGE
jgi:hypothetical protein